MTAHADVPDDPTAPGYASRCLLGLGILAVTVMLSNFPQLVQHPERYFDVPRPGDLARTLQTAGYALQIGIGLWLGLSLVFDVRRWRRVAVLLWPVTVALYFVPLPNARQDIALAPALFVGALALASLTWALDRTTRHASPA
jgi:hypothetical protein